eukprot:scaffold20310_cov125-Isochrysis_galbana.AAC.6
MYPRQCCHAVSHLLRATNAASRCLSSSLSGYEDHCSMAATRELVRTRPRRCDSLACSLACLRQCRHAECSLLSTSNVKSRCSNNADSECASHRSNATRMQFVRIGIRAG